MSDEIHEECGIAVVRLKKDFSYFKEKYDSPLWGLERLFLLLEKQQNRGQDGTGVACCKLNVNPGDPYLFRERNIQNDSISRIFSKLFDEYNETVKQNEDVQNLKQKFDFAGEVYLGHLRYGTSGQYQVSSCHPYFRRSNWPARNLMLVGNFNITNTSELNERLIDFGQHPIFDTDTQTLLEEIGFYLDQQHEDLVNKSKELNLNGSKILDYVNDNLDIPHVLKKSSRYWDGGFSLAAILGNGDTFCFRDAHGIRPMFYYENDEVFTIASERAPLMTVFDCNKEDIIEVTPGSVLLIKQNGSFSQHQILKPEIEQRCSFERIYFSRGNDPDIYQERKEMGKSLIPQLEKVCDESFSNTVFSFIPNTAEVAYYGLIQGLQMYTNHKIKEELLTHKNNLTGAKINKIFSQKIIQAEKIAIKDIKLRTFINREKNRTKLVSHVYDISYGSMKPNQNLVVLDDSVVRGTTLKQSIISILSRLNPKKIIVASTAPQIRYPDCYGIDMSNLGNFVAFQAVLRLIEKTNQQNILDEVLSDCTTELKKEKCTKNPLKKMYALFTDEEISVEIAKLITPENIAWKGEIQIVFQTIENLQKSLNTVCGDWYFSGNYPTPGGYRVACRSFVNFFHKKLDRSY